jgi:glycosyltransferase involved in cell wall biosynthesis
MIDNKDKSRIEVVFIARSLWGGGVEKVLYELAHKLDRNKFSPTVVYIVDEKNPIAYDPAIPAICLQSIMDKMQKPPMIEGYQTNRQTGIVQILGKIYRFLPESFRDRVQLGQKLRDLRNRLFHPGNRSSNASTQLLSYDYDIQNAISEVSIHVAALRKMLETFSKDAILIPMDELNTVILWLSQLPPYRKVIAAQHYPYSQAQPLRYPDENVRRVKEWLYLNACRAADIVTFDSEGSRRDLIDHYGASPKTTISMPNLIDCKKILEKSKYPLELDIKIPKRKTIFTQVARMTLEKNPLLLIEACEILRSIYDDFVVLYIGDGPLYKTMVEQIRQKNLENYIFLLGEQVNPYPYVKAARALLLTSRSESSPLVLVESMLCGTVPISTDCIAGPREILGDGKFGIIVPPADPKAYASAMHQIATNDEIYKRLRENALDRAWRFDTPQVVLEWEELILKVAENHIDS